MISVPCNGCVACCRASEVPRKLLDGENPEDYKTFRLPDGGYALRTKVNGDCIYLEDGCTIHKRKPGFCARYDCREVYSRYEDLERELLIGDHPELGPIFEAAERLNAAD